MSNTGATADFAVFSKWSAGFSVQYTGEMLTNRSPPTHPARPQCPPQVAWETQALLEQIMRGVRALGDKSVPHDLHQLSVLPARARL